MMILSIEGDDPLTLEEGKPYTMSKTKTKHEEQDEVDLVDELEADEAEETEGEAADITAKALAKQCKTDPKTFRRFLREHLRGQDVETPGQGGRYAFTKTEASGLIAAYAVWHAPKVKAPVVDDELEMSDEENEDLIAALEASIAQAGGTDSDEDEDVEDDTDEVEDEDGDLDEVIDPSEEDLEEIELEA